MDKYNAFDIVQELEYQLCRYTGAPYCVVVNSCTNALGITLEYAKLYNPGVIDIEIPKYTYVGVPMQIKRTGYSINFKDKKWKGEYQLWPLPIWDSARRFTKGMWEWDSSTPIMDENNYTPRFKCLSFHRTKILGYTQGGAILHDVIEFQQYAEMMRFDGRTPGVPAKDDMPVVLGRHCYMCPETAAALLHNLMYLPDINEDLPNSDYPDLSKMEIFK